ncbi:MAG: hypothetical protein WAQ98_16435 [Blastocatellia bacterium]
MSASLQPNTSVNANPDMAAMNVANVTNNTNSNGNAKRNNGNNGNNNNNGSRPYNNQASNVSKAQNQVANEATQYVNISQEENLGNTINNNELEDPAKNTRMNGSRSNYNRNYDSTNNSDTTRNRPDFRRDNFQRVPSVTIKAEIINNPQTRIFLEVIKGCFPTRLSDQSVIDGILAIADVDMEKLAQSFKSDFADPIYIPEANEDINVSLAKLQALIQAKQANSQANSQSTSNSDGSNGNQAGQEQGRDLRVTLLTTTYRLLSGYQRELRQQIYQQIDINAIANKVLVIGNYDTRAVVIAIRDYYQGVGKVQVGYSN